MKKIGLVLMATATLALSGCAELSNLYEETLESGKIRPALKGDTGLTIQSTWQACEEQDMWGKVSECRVEDRIDYCMNRVREGLNACSNPHKKFPNAEW